MSVRTRLYTLSRKGFQIMRPAAFFLAEVKRLEKSDVVSSHCEERSETKRKIYF